MKISFTTMATPNLPDAREALPQFVKSMRSAATAQPGDEPA